MRGTDAPARRMKPTMTQMRTSASPSVPAAKAEASPVPRADQVEAILQQLGALPTLSPIAARVMALSGTSDAEFDEIIGLIEADPSLSAKMLSLCRRSGVTGGRTITTVRRAVVHLGLEAVQSAVLSVEIYELMGQATSSRERRAGKSTPGAEAITGFDRVGYWRHAVGVACAAELIARKHPQLKVRPDEAFTAGLLHDLGKLALDWVLPKTYAKVVQLAQTRALPMHIAEQQILGLDHHVVGKRLAEHWSLPHYLQDSMWLHGGPTDAMPMSDHRTTVQTVTLADALCRELHIGWSGSAQTESELEAAAAALGLELAGVRQIAGNLHEVVSQRCTDLGLSDAASEELVLESIATANAQLARMQRQSQVRAATARTQSRLLEALAKFATAGVPGQLLGDVLADVAKSFMGLFEKQEGGFCAIVHQAREDGPWQIARLNRTQGTLELSGHMDPPRDVTGLPMQLVAGNNTDGLGEAIGLLTWLSEHMVHGDETPDVRTLRLLPLPRNFGPATVIIHDREWSQLVAGIRGAGDAVLGVWARAIASAGQHDGARKISEQLAQANREVVEMRTRMAEAQSLVRLGELAAGAAHEMNNPLTVISGKSQVLVKRLKEAKDRQDAQLIVQAATRMTDLVTSMHMIARPPEAQRQATSLNELLGGLARQLRGAQTQNTLQTPLLNVDTAGVKSRAKLDPKLFARAMGELVANALQAEPKTGVTITAWEDELDDRLRLEVTDDGVGLSAHALRHAFDPFFSEKKAGRRQGLGLAIARALIRQHDGEMWMTSEQGKGTTVHIALRNWRAGEETPERAAA